MRDSARARLSNPTMDPVLADLVEELLNRLQNGGNLDLQEHLRAFPQYAGELERLVPALEVLAGMPSRGGEPFQG